MYGNCEISVIVPVFNVEKYLKRCVDSLLNQAIDCKYAIYLIDDGSTDKSGEISDQYAKTFPDRINVFHKENGGQSSARNLGLDKCDSQYIAFVDSDDYVEPTYLHCLYQQCIEHNADIAMCAANRVKGEDGKGRNFSSGFEHSFVSKEITEICAKSSYSPVCKLIRRDLFENLRFPEGMTYEDMVLLPQVICRAKIISYVHSIEYHYYVNEKSTIMSRVKNKSINPYIIRAMGILEESYLKQYPRVLASIYFRRIIMGLCWSILQYTGNISEVDKYVERGFYSYSNLLWKNCSEEKGIRKVFAKQLLSGHYRNAKAIVIFYEKMRAMKKAMMRV